ncbi:MAG: hypothetical protein D6729_11790, partial [Deltaproteobacteria bacterium]
MGELLGVHPELAAFVVAELQTQGRVDEDWKVTKRGLDLLDEEQEESASLVPGWVFRDPWNDALWPFVASSLEYAQTERSDAGYPVLNLGTTGRPWRQRAWMQFPPTEWEGSMPDAREVLQAALRHARLGRRSCRLTMWDDEPGTVDPVSIDLNRISTIEPEAEPVFLVTYLYVPQDGDDADLDWHACDFFGRGSSPTLRRLVARVARHDKGLANELDALLGRTLHGGFKEFKRAAAAREYQARKLLEGALTIDIEPHRIADALAELLESWLEVRDLDEAAAQWRRRGVLASCRIVLERLFREVAETWPLDGVADQLSRDDREVNAARLRGTAVALGLDEVPPALCRVTQRQVRSVSEYDDSWRLRPLIVATMLRARDVDGHPLRVAAQKDPSLLGKIEHVIVSAGGAVHDGQPDHFDLASLEACVQETLEIVGLLLNLPLRPIREVL